MKTLTETQADEYLDLVVKDEKGLYKDGDLELPDYIDKAKEECSVRLTGHLHLSDTTTIGQETWEDIVHGTVAAHREQAEYEWSADNHCNCKDTWCPC